MNYFLKVMNSVLMTQNQFSCSCNSYNLLLLYQTAKGEAAANFFGNIFKSTCTSPNEFQTRSIFEFDNSDNCALNPPYPVFQRSPRCLNPITTTTQAAIIVNPNALIGTNSTTQSSVLMNLKKLKGLTDAQIAGVVVGFLGVIFLFFSLIYCLFPIEILACCFDLFPVFHRICPCKSGVISNKYYDVFVSYNKSSEYWIQNQLIPFFDKEKPNDR